MYWVALQASPDEDALAWAWRALQFTPRVALVDEAVLLEAGASERLFGGRKRLLRLLLKEGCELRHLAWAWGPTAVVALSLLRLKRSGQPAPALVPDDLPLATLTAAAEHLPTLERIGCTTLGQLRALPRAGLSRRFGAGLLQALDAAYGQRPERFSWVVLPAVFDQKLELPALATSAPELLLAAQHLLTRLQSWLQVRNLGVLAVELEWSLDLRRLDGKPLPPQERIELRTAQPTQDIHHLRRLAHERLARTAISAPANALRLRTLVTVPWGGLTTSLLPQDHRPGEKLHQLVERLSVRLGEGKVTLLQPVQDHRPECMQQEVAAAEHSKAVSESRRLALSDGQRQRSSVGQQAGFRSAHRQPAHSTDTEDALYPPWLLREPLQLQVKGDKPHYQGPLQLLTRARRIEAGWWDAASAEPVLRDYFIARGASTGLLWIFRERLAAEQDRPRWFLHGLYA